MPGTCSVLAADTLCRGFAEKYRSGFTSLMRSNFLPCARACSAECTNALPGFANAQAKQIRGKYRQASRRFIGIQKYSIFPALRKEAPSGSKMLRAGGLFSERHPNTSLWWYSPNVCGNGDTGKSESGKPVPAIQSGCTSRVSARSVSAAAAIKPAR